MRAKAVRSRSAPAFGLEIDGPAVLREGAAEAARALVRRQQGLLAGRELDGVEVVVAAVDEAVQERELLVARQVREPADAAVLRDQARRSARRRRRRRQSIASPLRRFEPRTRREPSSDQGPRRLVSLPPSVRRFEPGAVGADEVDLLVHAAARREREREPGAVGRPLDEADRVVERRDELRVSAGGVDTSRPAGGRSGWRRRRSLAVGRERRRGWRSPIFAMSATERSRSSGWATEAAAESEREEGEGEDWAEVAQTFHRDSWSRSLSPSPQPSPPRTGARESPSPQPSPVTGRGRGDGEYNTYIVKRKSALSQALLLPEGPRRTAAVAAWIRASIRRHPRFS